MTASATSSPALTPANPAVVATRPATPARARHTPSTLRAAAVALAVVAALGAVTTAVTSAARRSDVRELSSSTAAVAGETGDADAAFALAESQAAALASPGADASTELRYLQAMAAGVNALERAAQLTKLGPIAESPLRRALRSVPVYAADVARAQAAAAAGDTVAATAHRTAASATMANLVRGNAEAVSALHELAVQRSAASLRDGRRLVTFLTLVPLALLVVLLVAVQAWASVRFRRLLNVPLALATVLSVGVFVRTSQLQGRQVDRITAALDGPYTAERRLTEARVLAYEAQGRRTSAVASGASGALDGATVTALRAGVSAAAATTPDRATEIAAAVDAYLAVASTPSVAGSESPTRPGSAASRFNVLDGSLLTARADERAGVADAVAAAEQGQSTQTWLAPVLLAAAVALAWLGLQRRLAEYR